MVLKSFAVSQGCGAGLVFKFIYIVACAAKTIFIGNLAYGHIWAVYKGLGALAEPVVGYIFKYGSVHSFFEITA